MIRASRRLITPEAGLVADVGLDARDLEERQPQVGQRCRFGFEYDVVAALDASPASSRRLIGRTEWTSGSPSERGGNTPSVTQAQAHITIERRAEARCGPAVTIY